jgi:hypothetical protein
MTAPLDQSGLRASKPFGPIRLPMGLGPTTDKTNGVSLATDYNPGVLLVGMLITPGTGNFDIILEDGSEMIFPATCDAGTSEIIELSIQTIKSNTTTTFSGKIFPLI